MTDPTVNPTEGPGSLSPSLLERVRARDQAAWGRFYHLYAPLVEQWCAQAGLQDADAADVVQEVFQAAATHMEAFRRDRPGDSFRGWLRGITRNMVLQHFRRGARHPRGSGGTDALLRLQEVEVGGAAEPTDEDSAEELDGLRRRALELVRGEFEERTWQFFWQTVVEGRAPVDLAADAVVSAAAVRMAKSRVLHRLKEEFGELIPQ